MRFEGERGTAEGFERRAGLLGGGPGAGRLAHAGVTGFAVALVGM